MKPALAQRNCCKSALKISTWPAGCCPLKSKGAKPGTRRRGATHAEHMHELVYWDASTARLLPRLIKGRTRRPLLVEDTRLSNRTIRRPNRR
jgi:hypothetical protein